MSPARAWCVDIAVGMKPFTLNDRPGNFRWRARINKDWRELAEQRVAAAGLPLLQRARVELHVTPPDRRRRDLDNFVATWKPCLDAVVRAGVLPDDSPAYIDGLHIVLQQPDATKKWRVQLIITEQAVPA